VTWQPEPDEFWPQGPASDDGNGMPPGSDDQAARPPGRRRGRGKLAVFALLLVASLAGLAVSAVGIAHQLLPRQFTVAQRRQIATWELERRWRALPAGVIFPASVSYSVSASDLDSSSGLTLQARLLRVSPETSCATALSGQAAVILGRYGCTDAMRATYVDASGSLVATVAVAVLPDPGAERAAVKELTGSGGQLSPNSVRALRVTGTAASEFGEAQRQLTDAVSAGPYLILSTAGFTDGRRQVQLAGDQYLDDEMVSLASGLANSAERVLGKPLAPITCPGAPGC
jgi:hypothetical protein